MKTAEITRHKQAAAGVTPPSTWAVFADIYRREGIRGINKGVHAVALRQCTNWGSRMGFAQLAETPVRAMSGKSESEKLGPLERILCSSIGGALGTWNQPLEVTRIEMQSMASGDSTKPKGLGVFGTLGYIYKESGMKGLYRGVTPRIALGVWQTVAMVAGASYVRELIEGASDKGVEQVAKDAAEKAKKAAEDAKEAVVHK